MRLSVAVAAVAAVLACAPVIAANNSSSSSSSEVAIHAARELQERADDVARELQTAEHRVRSSHNVLHSRAIAHRNALLRRVPHFWYDALLGLPRYDGFLSLLPEDSGDFEITNEDDTFVHPDAMESAPWGADSETGYPAVADDHFILKNFLHEARCYVVKGGADVTREQLDQLVHAPGRSGNDGGVEDDGSRYYVPDDLDLGMSTQHGLGSHDVAEESYRVVLSFKPNPYFADQRLYKQLPIAHAHMLFTSDLDVQEALGLGPKLGQGNTVSWSSRTVRDGVLKPAKDNSPSFFAAFDDDVYASADRALKELLQMRAASFVSSLCMYLEPDPLPFWERRVVERESHVQRTKMILGTTKDPDGVEPVVPDDPPLDDEGVEAVPPPHEDEFVDLLNTTTDDEVQAESTSDHVSEEAPDVHQPVEEPTTQEDAGDEEQATPLSTADVETPIRAAVAVAEVETPSETTSPSPATTAAATSVPDPQPASGQTATIEQETHV